jgi:hypothetical protein
MKISKILLLGVAVAGFTAAASADVDIYIAGSTAYRPSVTKAILDVLTASGTNVNWGYNSSSNYKASAAIFSGTYGGTPVNVHTFWTGSVAGCLDLTSDNVITGFVPDGVTESAATAPTTTGTNEGAYGGGTLLNKTTSTSGTNYAPASASIQVAMSDVDITSAALSVATGSRSAATNMESAGTVEAGATGTAGTVGYLPFVWVAGAQTVGSAPYTNITQQVAAQLINNGFVTAEQLGDTQSSATNDWVFLVGRNEDSGTRASAQAEAQASSYLGLKSFGQTMVQSYLVFQSGTGGSQGAGTVQTDGAFPSDDTLGNGSEIGSIETGGNGTVVTDFGYWPSDAPLNTETAINWGTAGHSGQISGGDVANMLAAENPLLLSGTTVDGGASNFGLTGNIPPFVSGSSKCYFVGYLATSDFGGLSTTGTAPALTYNGVPYSAANVDNGSYSFFSFEHCYVRNTGGNSIGTGTAKNVAYAIADELYHQDCATDSSGNTDLETVPTDPKVSGLLFTAGRYTRAVGAPLIPNSAP